MTLKEREQTVKDLQEVVDNYSGSWQRFNVLDNALALIKELTEENEQWRNDWERNQSQWEEAYEKIETDTVKKMQERFSSLLEKEYKQYTPDGADHYFKNGSHMMWSIADRVFNQIAKEILEEANNV